MTGLSGDPPSRTYADSVDREAVAPELRVVQDDGASEPVPTITVVVQIDDTTVMQCEFEADPEKVGVIRFDPAKLRTFLDQHQPPKIQVYKSVPGGAHPSDD